MADDDGVSGSRGLVARLHADPHVYFIRHAKLRPELQGLWDGPAWGGVSSLEVAHFRPESSDHRPVTLCKLLHDGGGLYGHFKVEDRFVRAVHTAFQSEVYKDSCVELFLQPRADGGYFNFEFNCGGATLASYVTDPTRVDGRVRGAVALSPDEGRKIAVYHSMPSVVEPEITELTTWHIEFSIPFGVLGTYVGPFGNPRGKTWRGNLYKCANDTSHPHWAAWSPVSALNFHLPSDFGSLRFA
jgi:hypothetical protein